MIKIDMRREKKDKKSRKIIDPMKIVKQNILTFKQFKSFKYSNNNKITSIFNIHINIFKFKSLLHNNNIGSGLISFVAVQRKDQYPLMQISDDSKISVTK